MGEHAPGGQPAAGGVFSLFAFAPKSLLDGVDVAL
jgi:hypothetical protein